MDSPHIKSSCGTQNVKNSNPIPIGLGIFDLCHMDENPKMDSPQDQIFMWDTKKKFQSYGYRVRN